MPVRQEELKSLKETILKMASLVEASIRDSVKALLEKDTDLARKVIDNDHYINALDVHIDEECIRLIARRQPVATDLRFITTAMKITTDLERIADHSVNIAQRVIRINEVLNDMTPLPHVEISRIKQVALGMLRDAIDAFINEDKRLAMDVILRDDEADDLNAAINDDLLKMMIENQDVIIVGTNLTYISRNLERIADHATNICEMIVYMIEGRIIRHMADLSEE